MLNVVLAEPRGFCAGVERAIEIVEKAIQKFGAPVYVRHEIVHNKYVVEDLRKKGAVFVNEVDEIPDGAITIFSAHGVSEKVENAAKVRDLPLIDATCPLVTKVHIEAQKNEAQGRQIILIGHAGHPEVEGTSGRVKGEVIIVSSVEEVEQIICKVKDPSKLAYVTQTTLSVDDTAKIIAKITEVFPEITGPNLKDICYATQNRQNAVRELAKISDVIFVIGAKNSSNSNRLKDLALELNVPAYLIDDERDIDLKWLEGKGNLGITAGASAPEVLLENVMNFLKSKFEVQVNIMDGIKETIKFKLPRELVEI